MRQILCSLCICFAVTTGANAQNITAKLIHLHDDLHLGAAQENGWRAYTDAIAPDPQAEARHHATQQLLGELTTPRRIALIDATMQADIADMRRQGDAVAAFYATLSPDQQKIFDRETNPETQLQSDPSND